ncbi:MAG: septum formation inhibitor Maf [Campylobacter sp.]|nr:septum formation inhibitor Maf [Campylobacter sp.]
MIYLASSSQTRAKILQSAGIEFEQIFIDFDESGISKTQNPFVYAQNVVKAKQEQFEKIYPKYDNVLFADSCVECNGEILGKPKNGDDAYRLLKMQSDNYAKVITAMLFKSSQKTIINVSSTLYKFAKFDEDEIYTYIISGECMDKAGAMMVEGFNKAYIKEQIGYTSTARGLNVEILKAFL